MKFTKKKNLSFFSRRDENHSLFSLFVPPTLVLHWLLLVTVIALLSTSLLMMSTAKAKAKMTTSTMNNDVTTVPLVAHQSSLSLRGVNNKRYSLNKDEIAEEEDNVDNYHWVVSEYKKESTRKWFGHLKERLQCPTKPKRRKLKGGSKTKKQPGYYNHIPNANVWNILYEAYHYVVDPDHKILQYDNYQKDAWHVPVEVKYDPNKGRGVYAKHYIKNGTTIWSAAVNSVEYHSGDEFRHVLEYILVNATKRIPTIDGITNLPMLITPKDIVCDATMWIDCALDNYTQLVYWKDLGYNDDDTNNDKTGVTNDDTLIRSHYRFCQTYDEGVLFNTYDKGKNKKNTDDIDTPIDKDLSKAKHTPNLLPALSLSYPKEKHVMLTSICHFGDIIALGDIQAGEELLLDYGEYSHGEGWKYFDLDRL